ncbi:MAG: hypothetical protein M3N68_11455 [Actinomycetota bacterium]|nr:hypothetical protein [Actinomycetota bacterium]
MKLLLVVNPTASAVKPKGRAAIERALSVDHDLAVVETAERDHATELARDAASDGIEVVVVLGGDGTQNEAANGLAGTSTALAALPGGSTNVFARTIGFPNDAVAATDELVAALAGDARRRVGLGTANGRYFLFHVGLGFDAAVVEQVEKRSELKRRFGQAVFVYATFSTWFRHFDRSRPHFTVRFADEDVVDGYFAICLKTNPYTFLGKRPFNVAPDAGFDRRLAMVTFTDLRFATVGGAALAALSGSGQRLRQARSLEHRSDLESITVTAHQPFGYQVDGDYLGQVETLELGHQPSCLDLICPPR